MLNIDLLEQIELKYNKNISEVKYEDENIIVFFNKTAPTMYDYNFIYVKKELNLDELQNLIYQEKVDAINSERNYLKICFKINSNLPQNIHEYCKELSGECDKIAFMTIDKSKIYDWKKYDNIKVILIKDSESLNKFIELNYQEDLKISKQYADNRRNLILNQYNNKNFQLYSAYYNENVVGTAEVFLSNKMAKIENVFVGEPYRNKGACTELLRKIINDYSEDIYLTTDINDEPINLYKKLNFNVISNQINTLYLFK